MSERSIANEAMHIGFLAMIVYWVLCTKSGRICLFLLFILGVCQECSAPRGMTETEDTPIARCRIAAHRIWNDADSQVALQACYDKYVIDTHTPKGVGWNK